RRPPRAARGGRLRELEARQGDAALPRGRARAADPYARVAQERGLRGGRDTHRRERPACSRGRNPVRRAPPVAGAGSPDGIAPHAANAQEAGKRASRIKSGSAPSPDTLTRLPES